MALPTAVVEEGVSKVFSYISTKLDDKACREETIARLEIALSRLDIALEKTGRIPITYVSLLRSRKVLKRVYTEGTDLLKKHRQQEELDGHEKKGHVVVRSSSYLHWIVDRAANFSISSLVGLGKEKKLSVSDAQTFERYADWAEKFVGDVESGRPLRHDTYRYPFLRHLLEGKSLKCQIIKNPSQSLSVHIQPEIVEGRGVEVILLYEYNDLRNLEECFSLELILRISEDTNIIGTSIKCIQRLTSHFKLVAQSAIGELAMVPNLQDTFHSYVHLPSFTKDKFVCRGTEFFRPDPICCIGNSCGTLGNKSSMEIPEPVIKVSYSSYISAPENSLRNAPLSLTGVFVPHFPCWFKKEICTWYGGKSKLRKGGSVQQVEEIAASDALDYLVHEPEPTDYVLGWLSTHGGARVILKTMPRPSRRVSKRKR